MTTVSKEAELTTTIFATMVFLVGKTFEQIKGRKYSETDERPVITDVNGENPIHRQTAEMIAADYIKTKILKQLDPFTIKI